MAMPVDFIHESLYTPDQWYIHDLLDLDIQGGKVVGLMDTTRLGALQQAQRPWPGQPPHVPGAAILQATGTLGNLHAVYALSLRMTDGWVGFGTHVHQARYGRIGQLGPPVIATLRALDARHLRGAWFVRYSFEFKQEGQLLYSSEQSAAWSRGDHRGPPPEQAAP